MKVSGFLRVIGGSISFSAGNEGVNASVNPNEGFFSTVAVGGKGLGWEKE